MIIYIFAFITGCSLGSFMNVVISRNDWYKGRSRCDNCGYTLKWFDLIPLVSFIALGGRCRKCKKPISASHIFSELCMGAAFLAAPYLISKFGYTEGPIYAYGIIFLSIFAIEDIKWQAIHSWLLNLGVISSAMVRAYLIYSENGVRDAVLFLIIISGLKLVFSVLGKYITKLGAGDLDIFLVIYSICGLYRGLISITLAAVLGCLIYLPQIFTGRMDRKKTVPFAPLLFAGTVICYLIMKG